MNRKDFIELALEAMEVFGDLHDRGVLDAQGTIQVIGEIVVDAFNEGYDEVEEK